MRSDRMKLERPHSERSEQTMSEKIVQLNEEVIKGTGQRGRNDERTAGGGRRKTNAGSS